jgi:hypothetical protein
MAVRVPSKHLSYRLAGTASGSLLSAESNAGKKASVLEIQTASHLISITLTRKLFLCLSLNQSSNGGLEKGKE